MVLANTICQPALQAGTLSGDLYETQAGLRLLQRLQGSVTVTASALLLLHTASPLGHLMPQPPSQLGQGHVIFILIIDRDTATGFLDTVLPPSNSASVPLGIPETSTHQSVPTHTHSPTRRALRPLKSTPAFQASRELKRGMHRCRFYIFYPQRLSQVLISYFILYESVFCLYLRIQTVCMQCPQGQDGVRALGSAVTDCSEPLCGG